MSDDELNRVVDAYIRYCKSGGKGPVYEENYWAAEVAMELCWMGPVESLWILILAVLAKDTSDEVLQLLSAGPLEDLLAKHGNAFIERIELEARQNPQFRDLLGGVWQNSMTDDIWQRVEAARLHKKW